MFPETYILSWLGDQDLSDPSSYSRELGRSSAVTVGLHQNNVIKISRRDQVLASGLVKFRAGLHTDLIGVSKVGSPYHVPWVWNEFVLTYADGNYFLHIAAASFPTTAWYVDGQLIDRQRETVDQFFPTEKDDSSVIATAQLRIMPVLDAGLPVTFAGNTPLRQYPNDSPPGPITEHPYTVRLYKESTTALSAH